jgi:hypothetical protein
MFHPISRHGLPHDGKLSVPHRTYDSARAMFPHCEASAVRAFVRSEASRLANSLILPRPADPEFDGLVALFTDVEWSRMAAVRSRRFDLVTMLLRNGRFQRKITLKLMRQGKIGADTARAVLA